MARRARAVAVGGQSFRAQLRVFLAPALVMFGRLGDARAGKASELSDVVQAVAPGTHGGKTIKELLRETARPLRASSGTDT